MARPRLLVSGVINWDTTLFVDRLPAAGEELQVRLVITGPGGKGANTAAAAAGILGSLQVGIIGGIGTDEIATRQLHILEREGIDTSCVVRQENLASGAAYIIVDRSTGENIVLTNMSANELKKEPLLLGSSDVLSTAIKSAEMLVVIDPPLDIASALAQRANAGMKQLVLSPALLTQQGLASLKQYLERGDVIILNESESKFLSKSGADALGAGRELSQVLGGKSVVVTLGSQGCMLFSDGKRALIPPLDLLSFGLKVVNTVGAGDTFVGTFASFKLEGLDFIESLFLANVAAGLKTTREETRGSPSKHEIMQYAGDSRLSSALNSIRLG